MPFIICLIAFDFLFKRIDGGHCLGVVTRGDNVTHKHFTEMRKLAHVMRPPFSWLCHQEPLPWFGDQIDGSVIPLHAHGPNSRLMMRPPIHQLVP
jgi:hypothetical protein